MIPKELRAQMIRYCKRMDGKGWVANHDGNLSVRVASGFVSTPTARAKADLEEEDLLELDSKGKRTGGGSGAPFSELAIHLRVYSARSDAQAVVHAHPVAATAVGSANQELVTWAIPEAVVSLGPGIPLVGLSLPGSEAFSSEFDSLLKHYDAVMVAGNGVFTWGKTLEQAFLRLELVEHVAAICLASLPLGGPKLLAPGEVQALLKKRADAGLALPADPSRPQWFSG